MKTSLFCTLAAACALVAAKEPLDYIDPLIGTEGKGSQYGGMMPMTGVPFGSIQWVPMTRLTEVGSLSYNEIDTQLLGFIGTRQPAIWMGDWGQVSFMPRTGAVDCDFATRGTPFDHAREQVSPWRTRIASGGIVTDSRATTSDGRRTRRRRTASSRSARTVVRLRGGTRIVSTRTTRILC